MNKICLILSTILFFNSTEAAIQEVVKGTPVLKFIPEKVTVRGKSSESAVFYDVIKKDGDEAFIAYYSDAITATVISEDQYMQQCIFNMSTNEIQITDNWSIVSYKGKEMILHQYQKAQIYTDPQFTSQEMVTYW